MAKRKRYATREELLEVLKSKALRREEITVPEWGGLTFFLQELTVRQQREIFKATKDGSVEVEDTVKLLQYACVTKEGEPLFDDDHLEILMDQSGLVVAELIQKISAMNTVQDEAEEEKNSQAPDEDSATP